MCQAKIQQECNFSLIQYNMFKKEKDRPIKQESDQKSWLESIFQKQRSWKQYEKLAIIGNSKWSTVFRVKDNKGRVLAIKVLNLYEFQKAGIIKNVYRQMRIIQELNKQKDQTHFVRLIDTLRLSNQLGLKDYCIIMELQQINLRNFIDNQIKNLPFLQRLKLCINLVECMEKLHGKGIIHRDLKPANILLRKTNENYAIVLCDFGLSKEVSQSFKMTIILGTAKYKHPQIQSKKLNYSYEFDLYGLGLIIYEILTGRFICELTKEEKQDKFKLYNRMNDQLANIDQILQNTPQLQGSSMKIIKNIIKGCLDFQTAKELSISDDIKQGLIRIYNQEQFEVLKNLQQGSGRNSTIDTKKTEEQFQEENNARLSDIMASQRSKSQISNVNSSKLTNKQYFSGFQRRPNYQIAEEDKQLIETLCKKQKFSIQLSQEQQNDVSQIQEEYQVSRILRMISMNTNKLSMQKFRVGIQNNSNQWLQKQKMNEKYKQYENKFKELKKWQQYNIKIQVKRKLIFLALMWMKNQIRMDSLSQKFVTMFQNIYRDHLMWCRNNISFHFKVEFRRYVTANIQLHQNQKILTEFRKTIQNEYLDMSLFQSFF